MNATDIVTAWQERAVSAYRAKEAEVERCQRERAEEDLKDQIDDLRMAFDTLLDVAVVPTSPTTEIDGIRWTGGHAFGRYWLARLDTCPDCGAERMTDRLTTEVEIGEAIVSPRYDWHRCAAKETATPTPQPDDARTRFIRAFRELIAEVDGE